MRHQIVTGSGNVIIRDMRDRISRANTPDGGRNAFSQQENVRCQTVGQRSVKAS